MTKQIKKYASLKGVTTVSPDKSVSHRSLMIGALSEGITRINNLSKALDVKSTIDCLELMGVRIWREKLTFFVEGKGFKNLITPYTVLNAENSGTTMRLLSGIIAGADIRCTILGDRSLNRRPMKRIIEPLRLMGANITSGKDGKPPLTFNGGTLHGIDYRMPIPSAQVKSCLLFAGLNASGNTAVHENVKTRDHTEKMLMRFVLLLLLP